MAERLARAFESWAAPYFVAALLTLGFAALVQSRGRGAMRRPFGALLGSVAAALLGWGVVHASDDPRVVLWACRFTMAAGAWSVPASIGFVAALLEAPRPRLVRASLFAAAAGSLAALASPWVVAGTRGGRFGLMGAAGPIYPALLVEMSPILAVPVLILRRLAVEPRPLVRRRLQSVLISSMVGALALGDLAGPVGIDVPPLGWLPLTLGSLLLLFGVIRYRLLDLRLALWRLVLWLALTASGALPFAVAAAMVVRHAPPRSDWEAALLGAGLLAAMLGYLEGAQPPVDALVGQRRRNLADELATLESQLAALQTVPAIGFAVDRFLRVFERRLAAMVVIDERGRPELALSAWGAVPVPTRDSPLLFELAQARAPISVDEVRGPARLEIERACVRWGAEYLGPLVDGEQLLGLVAISPRQQGGTARIEEVEAIDRVCVAAAAALARARLLQRLEGLSQELEHKAALRSASLERALGDLRGAEARLFASEKLATLGQIVAGVAADLRDQVDAVFYLAAELRAEAEVLQQAGEAARAERPRDERFDDMVRDLPSLLDAVGEGARRASTIAQDLYGFAPLPDRPEPVAERRPTPLDRIVDSTLTLLGAQLRRISIDRRFDRTLPDVPVEPGPMGQVVLNLVLNAAQAMQGHGRLEVGTRSAGDWAELFVSDSGPGIPADVLAHIFEPFFTTKGPAAGTGLGLSVSFGIVQRHGGRILVESPPEGGSTFRVQLPLR